MAFGERLKAAREKAGITQTELSDMVKIHAVSLSRYETNDRLPKVDDAQKLAAALGVTVAYLMGETDGEMSVDPSSIRILDLDSTIEIPVLDDILSACAGNGNGYCDVTAYATDVLVLPRDWVGPISPDPDKRPFILSTDGDSMEEAGIPEGFQVLVNPAAEVYSGDIVVVIYDDNWAVKWLYWDRDGGAELCSATPKYPPRHFTREDFTGGRIRILGKVLKTVGDPKRGE